MAALPVFHRRILARALMVEASEVEAGDDAVLQQRGGLVVHQCRQTFGQRVGGRVVTVVPQQDDAAPEY